MSELYSFLVLVVATSIAFLVLAFTLSSLILGFGAGMLGGIAIGVTFFDVALRMKMEEEDE